ncbi:MAG: hypothetical protein WED10_09175 [Brumimicrobium sp.]
MAKKEEKLFKIAKALKKHEENSKKLKTKAIKEKNAFKQGELIAKSEIEDVKAALKQMEFDFTNKYE